MWATEGPGGAPAAQTPAGLGRPARPAARRSPVHLRGGGRFGAEGCQAISECCWAISAGLVLRARVHEGQCTAALEITADVSVILLLMVVWIVISGGSSGRLASGMTAGIWFSGVFLTMSRGLKNLPVPGCRRAVRVRSMLSR